MSMVMAEYQKILMDNLEFAQHRLSQRSAVNQALAQEVMDLAKRMIDQNLEAYEKLKETTTPQDLLAMQKEFYLQNMEQFHQFTLKLAHILGEDQ